MANSIRMKSDYASRSATDGLSKLHKRVKYASGITFMCRPICSAWAIYINCYL